MAWGVMACGARSGLLQYDDLTRLGTGAPPIDQPRVVLIDPEPATSAASPERARPDLPAADRPSAMPEPEEALEPLADPLLPAAEEPDEPAPPPSDDESLPEECRLAPVDPDLPDEGFEVLGELVAADFAPPQDEQWGWAGQNVEDPGWPFPSRPLWPSAVDLSLASIDELELVAIAGSSPDDVYVVGRAGSAALVLHGKDGSWTDESAALLAVLPDASRANSVTVPSSDQVWLSTPEGLLRSDGAGQWQLVDVPLALFPLGAVWINPDGFGVVAGGSVATTEDGGEHWQLETRELGFVAPGLAYSRSFVRIGGHDREVAVVGAYGHLLTRGDEGWTASTLLASDVAFSAAGQFVTTRTAQGLFFRNSPETWEITPLTLNGGLDRVWASEQGDVFAGGDIAAVLHRFADGTVELLPSEVTGLRDFYGDSSRLYALAPTSLWLYDLGASESSGVSIAAAIDEDLLQIAPMPETQWGRSAASNFEPLLCVDQVLTEAGAPVWQGELSTDRAEARYGSCSNADERQFSETAFSFTAPSTGTYRIVLDEPVPPDDDSKLRLALRNGCEGWMIWGGGFGSDSPAVDIGLEAGQVVLIEVYASEGLQAPVPYELSIY